MFIKLTKWESDSKHDVPIYLNPLIITSIKAEDEPFTYVGTVVADEIWTVVETPEEIMGQIESMTKYYFGMLKGETY